MFKGDTISVPPFTYHLSKEYTRGRTVEETVLSFSDKQISIIY